MGHPIAPRKLKPLARLDWLVHARLFENVELGVGRQYASQTCPNGREVRRRGARYQARLLERHLESWPRPERADRICRAVPAIHCRLDEES